MGRKSKYIKELTKEEYSALSKGYALGESPLYRRKCHCILLSYSGKTTNELSTIFDVSKQSILKWLNLWESVGIQGLQLKPGRGRKPKLDITKKKHVTTVKKLIENEPKNLSRVTTQIKQQLGVDMSKKTLKRFLKNLNIDGNASVED